MVPVCVSLETRNRRRRLFFARYLWSWTRNFRQTVFRVTPTISWLTYTKLRSKQDFMKYHLQKLITKLKSAKAKIREIALNQCKYGLTKRIRWNYFVKSPCASSPSFYTGLYLQSQNSGSYCSQAADLCSKPKLDIIVIQLIFSQTCCVQCPFLNLKDISDFFTFAKVYSGVSNCEKN